MKGDIIRMCHTLYFSGMSWRQFECIFSLPNDLRWSDDGRMNQRDLSDCALLYYYLAEVFSAQWLADYVALESSAFQSKSLAWIFRNRQPSLSSLRGQRIST